MVSAYLPLMLAHMLDRAKWIDTFSLVIDLLFVFDVGVNMISVMVDEDGKWEEDLYKILTTYFKFWFYIDFFSALPYETFFYEYDDKNPPQTQDR
jgi:hypothetical protein